MRLADGTHGAWLYQCTSNARNRHGRKKFLVFGKRAKEEQCPKSDGWKVPMYKGKLPVVDEEGVRLNQQGVDVLMSVRKQSSLILPNGRRLPVQRSCGLFAMEYKIAPAPPATA